MATFESAYRKNSPRKFKNDKVRRPYRAYFYMNGTRTYLGNFATREEAEQREYTEKLRYQRELLEEFPEEIKHVRQQRLAI